MLKSRWTRGDLILVHTDANVTGRTGHVSPIFVIKTYVYGVFPMSMWQVDVADNVVVGPRR